MKEERKKHSKHSKLERTKMGRFGRNEWAIIGAPCGTITKLAADITKQLSQQKAQYKVAYLDADHNPVELSEDFACFDGFVEDKTKYKSINYKKEISDFEYKNIFNESDIVLVNGNHFTASQQIVILDEKKLESLSRKTDRLTNVKMIIKNGVETMPDFLKECIENDIEKIPILELENIEGITEIVLSQIQEIPLYGLVLSGGKSSRMGEDKAQIDYHGTPQIKHLVDLLSKHFKETFVSVGMEDTEGYNEYQQIKDKFVGLGAYGGILSAFMQNPNAAYLVVAIDMPNIDADAVKQLVEARNPAQLATAFHNEATDFPDPLFTIFEPKSYPKLLQYLSLGYSCPRKMLINESIELVKPKRQDLLLNINTPSEREKYDSEKFRSV